jgi:ABC-type glycerol-3-phosphate transport system permease component
MKRSSAFYLKKIPGILGIIILCVVALFFLFPLLWLADASFRPQIEMFNTPPVLIEKGPIAGAATYTLDNMGKALFKWNVILAFFNSVYITLSGIAFTLLISSMCAYAFSYLNFPFKRVVFMIILSTMMLPMTTMIVPYFRMLAILKLVGNPLGIIIPYGASAFGVFLLRQYLVKIPFSFIESARMEGANDFRILFQIIIPLAKPALAALSITQFRTIWNDFLYPMLILKNQAFFTLPIKIQFMDSQNLDKPYDAIIATGFIAALIPIIFFLIFQRQFIEGMTGGIKH